MAFFSPLPNSEIREFRNFSIFWQKNSKVKLPSLKKKRQKRAGFRGLRCKPPKFGHFWIPGFFPPKLSGYPDEIPGIRENVPRKG